MIQAAIPTNNSALAECDKGLLVRIHDWIECPHFDGAIIGAFDFGRCERPDIGVIDSVEIHARYSRPSDVRNIMWISDFGKIA